MIRQAHTYLAGAVSSTALVAAAVVAFVLLVSFQALRDWPLAGIGIGGDDSAATGPSAPGSGSATSPAETGAAAAGPVVAKGSARQGNGGSAARRGNQTAVNASPVAATGSPTAEAPASSPATQGGNPAPRPALLAGRFGQLQPRFGRRRRWWWRRLQPSARGRVERRGGRQPIYFGRGHRHRQQNGLRRR